MEEKKEFKDTLNLPSTTLAMRANAAVKEIETQNFWEENKIYEKNLAQRDKANSFVLHDGPPYLSSDKIHIGTALNKILKDIIIKYKSQKGFYAPYVPGYDAHGLPIENAVAKTIKGGKDAISPYELRQKCREFALKNLKGQEANFRRLGVWGNWEHPYISIAPDFEAEQIRVFGEIYKKGYIQKGLKPVYWCPHCETALAEAEVEYEDITSDSIYVKFEVLDKNEFLKAFNLNSLDAPCYMVIWTTTPWTIPSNLAISLHPNFEYGLYKFEGSYYVVAVDLLDAFVKDIEKNAEDFELIAKTKGQNLENINTKHPILNKKSRIITGEHVTLDAGTGAVHTAPGHGLEDWEVCQKYNIETFSPLDKKGRWTSEVKELEGVYYEEGNEIVINKLTENGALIKKTPITHSYPHCWRCKQPVIYRATPQWFVKVGDFMEKSLKAVEAVKWVPAAGEKRISNMIKNRTDWCISRQRAWGVPIPVIYCKKCGKAIINDESIKIIADIFEKESSDAWVKYPAEHFLPAGTKCECGSCEFEKETDIMDVWFDSGVSWRAVVQKRASEFAIDGKNPIPVDMYLEGSDQHRGWFQSSLLTCAATVGMAPYKTVLTHGFVLDGEGRKMSKSLGNVILPQEVTKVYGADVLRLWAASVDYRNDIKIGQNIIAQLVEVFKKTRNTARFLLGNLFDFDPAKDYVKYEDLKTIDKFALSKLNKLIANVDEAFESYEFYKYFQYLQNFATVDLSSFYLDIVKDRLYTAGKKSVSRRACQTVMYEVLQALVRILVPVMPHQAEDIWQNTPDCQRGGLISILLSDWPKVNPAWNNETIEEEYSEILKVREIVSKALEPLRADKTIGSSLEADVLITGANSELLEKYKDELSDLFIVSHAHIGDMAGFNKISEYEQDGIKVEIQKAQGEKCQRCWKYRSLNESGICPDCAEAIK